MSLKNRTKRWKRIAALTFFLMGSLVATMVINAWRMVSLQIVATPVSVVLVDEEAMVNRFAASVRIKTVTTQSTAARDDESFIQFADHLKELFPELHQAPFKLRTGNELGSERNHSLLWKWTGTESGQTQSREAVLLMAHYDVVPAETESLSQWKYPPFSGHIDDDFVWGRGTLDAKNGVMAIMEAMVSLHRQGFQPTQTLYVSLGHDEESGGHQGNRMVAQWMRRQGVRLDWVLDEGGCILNDFPGLDSPVAMVGVTEKGYMTLELQADVTTGGHSSMPPPETSIGVLANALVRLGENPFPRRLSGGGDLMLKYLGPEMPWTGRLAIANPWLFEPLILKRLGGRPSGNAMLRTTMVPTLIKGGVRENVLPSVAKASVNVRILPGDTSQSVLERIKEKVNDPRVKYRVGETLKEPSPISSTNSDAFRTLHTTIKEVYPDVVVAPFPLIGGTDSSHFQDISRDIYRFFPVRLGESDLARIHGVNERIRKEDYLNLVRYYIRLIGNRN